MSKTQILVQVTDEEKSRVRTVYGITETTIKKDVEDLRSWLIMQSHLPNEYDDEELERYLLNNKFLLDKTKKKLEKLFTYRATQPKYFFFKDVLSQDIINLRRSILMAPLPHLTPNLERIVLLKFLPRPELWSLMDFCSLVITFFDLSNRFDYALTYIHIIDFEFFTFDHMKNVDIFMFLKFFHFHQESFSARLKSLNFINLSTLLGILMKCLQIVMPSKLFKKIKIHKCMNDLHKDIPLDCLPKDYGGNLKLLSHYHELCDRELVQHRDWLNDRPNKKSNESLRKSSKKSKEPTTAAETQESFRNLNLD